MNIQRIIIIEDKTIKKILFEFIDGKYIFVFKKSVSFETSDKKVENFSKGRFIDFNYSYDYSNENIYFLLPRKYIPIEEYKNSTQKAEYLYLYERDDEMKGDNFTVENEGIIAYSNDFIIWKIFHDRDST